jgi:hypothetical protein
MTSNLNKTTAKNSINDSLSFVSEADELSEKHHNGDLANGTPIAAENEWNKKVCQFSKFFTMSKQTAIQQKTY